MNETAPETTSSPKSNLRIYVIILLIILGVAGCVQLSHYYVSLPEIDRLGASGHMKQEAERAVRLAQDVFQVDLDYSPESVEHVEQIRAKSREHHLQDPNADRSITPSARSYLWGACIGEVIKRIKPSEWKIDPETKAVTLQLTEEAGQPVINPMRWCYQRIIRGEPEDNVWYNFLLVTVEPDPSQLSNPPPQQGVPGQ